MELKSIKLRNGATLTIRKAKKEDAIQIIEYLENTAGETAYLTFGPGEINPSAAEEEKTIEDYLNSVNQVFLLAEVNKKVVGCLTFKAINRQRIRHTGIFGMSIAKEYWSLGIGTNLVESLVEWAKLSGIIRKINLKVRTDNTRALELYKRLDFVHEGLITREHLINGRFYDCVCMGMQID